MDYKKLLIEFMDAVARREGDYFVKDVIIFDVANLSKEEESELYRLYLES